VSDRQIPDNVINRVRKLLAVANDGRGNENEAANAAAMAQSIIAEYGLEMAQLADTPSSDPSASRSKTSHNRAAMYSYQRSLMEAVAKVYFCRHFIIEEHAESFGKMRKVKRHALLGRNINIQVATMVYDYLIDTMDRLLPYQGMEKRGKNALLWLDGCSSRLISRLDQKRRQMEEDSDRKRREDETRARHPGAASAGNAMVLAELYSNEDDLNTDFIHGLKPGTTTAERKASQARWAAQKAQLDDKRAALIAEGIDEDLARYIASYGGVLGRKYYADYLAEKEKSERQVSKPETEAQRRKREERQERENNHYRQQSQRRNAKLYEPAYQAGLNTGAHIGLDDQLTEEQRRKIG